MKSPEELEREIEQRKRFEDRLEHTNTELERSNKELQEFAYVASHDLQEPLRAVAGFTRLLQNNYQGQLDSTADEYIQHAVEGAERMHTLIDHLLEFSRVGRREMSPQPTDCNQVFDKAVKNVAALIEESGAAVTKTDLPTVMADSSQLVQVLQNLISNAIKFHGCAPPKVEVSAQERDGEWVFSVKDNGIGISPEFVERVFVIFQRLHTRSHYPGAGIGLAICKKIIERHDGRIWFESHEGQEVLSTSHYQFQARIMVTGKEFGGRWKFCLWRTAPAMRCWQRKL